MRVGLISFAVVLTSFPASRAAIPQLPQRVIDVLTPIDSVPSTTELNNVFAMPPEDLRSIALDATMDIGIAVRAIRALPSYCPPAPEVCGPGTIAHDTLIELIDGAPSPQSPQQLMKLRAAVEALGATQSGLSADVDKLMPLLSTDSRDLQVTVVRALRNICTDECN